jgi:hypothetical protein
MDLIGVIPLDGGAERVADREAEHHAAGTIGEDGMRRPAPQTQQAGHQ